MLRRNVTLRRNFLVVLATCGGKKLVKIARLT